MTAQPMPWSLRRRWYLAGVVSVVISGMLLVAFQAAEHDWLPPTISFSQYGLGPFGWMFSLFLVSFAGAPILAERAMPSRRWVRVLLVLGFLGCLLMAVVPTDPGGLQESVRAKVHLGGAAFGLSMTPLGAMGALLQSRRIPRPLTLALAVISTGAIILLLISATGVDTLGVGPQTSWAIWQTVAALADLALVWLMAVTNRPHSSV